MNYEQHKTYLVIVYDQHAEGAEQNGNRGLKSCGTCTLLIDSTRWKQENLAWIESGSGRDGLFFKAQGLQVTCIDLYHKMVEYYRQKGVEGQFMDIVHLDSSIIHLMIFMRWSALHTYRKTNPSWCWKMFATYCAQMVFSFQAFTAALILQAPGRKILAHQSFFFILMTI